MIQWVLILVFLAACFAYYMSQKQRIRREQQRERREEQKEEFMQLLKDLKDNKQTTESHDE